MLERAAEIEDQLRDPFSHNLKDKGQLQGDIQRIQARLAEDDSLKARGRGKDKVKKQVDQLADRLRKEISPVTLQFIRPGDPDYRRAMDAAWNATDPSVVRLAEQYQDGMRRLEPDDPNAASIERLISK